MIWEGFCDGGVVHKVHQPLHCDHWTTGGEGRYDLEEEQRKHVTSHMQNWSGSLDRWLEDTQDTERQKEMKLFHFIQNSFDIFHIH